MSIDQIATVQPIAARAEEITHALHDPTLHVRVNAKGPSNRQTGYGTHFVELVLAMLRQGADCRVFPFFCEPPLPPEFLACMLEPWDYDAPVGVSMANPMHLSRIAAHTIGITTWETTKIPPDLFRRSIGAFDELLVPCEDNIALFAELVPDIPCSYVPEGVDHDFFYQVDRDWLTPPLKIGMYGALTYRKGIDLGVEAFIDLYANNPNVELHIWTTFHELPQFHYLPMMYSNIKVHRGGWATREKVREFYHSIHALFAPARGEGFYLPGGEMMATGGILIAPKAMGFKAYHSEQTGWVIPSHFGPVKHWGDLHGHAAWSQYGEWIEYDPDDIRDTLKSFVDSEPHEKQRKSRESSGQAPFLLNWDYSGQKTIDHVVDAYRAAA